MNSFIPKLSITGLEAPFKANLTGHVRKLQLEPEVKGPGFKDVMTNLVQNLNETTSAPDKLMHEAMTTGRVDVHDVMIANAKAELVVNVTTQVATKVIQAYDKILQIQI